MPTGFAESRFQRRTGGLTRSDQAQMRRLAGWAVQQKWSAPRVLKTPEVQQARKLFYELDAVSDANGA